MKTTNNNKLDMMDVFGRIMLGSGMLVLDATNKAMRFGVKQVINVFNK